MTPTRDWDAESYARVAAPVAGFGRRLLERLELRGDETVLDAGCGAGGVTAELAVRLPRGRVIGVDGSASMIARARERLGATADLRVVDLLELELEAPVDLVFSSATFHWIADHDRLFARLFDVLRPGGRLLAQCGGEGNIAGVMTVLDAVTDRPPFAERFAGWDGPWHYAAPAETVARLERVGFVDAEAGLHDEPVRPEAPREYLATIVLGSHLERLPAELHDPFLDAVLARLGEPVTVGYVRLTLSARRPG